ncbi:ankyrin repeat-containing protein NPR4-like isoform X2 [Durio zibethinus]|uniref:Ankyrin repeat-containing protein NPR4-like isoform X2 n=1 Tax=Durio zibethinus TaxID=66656 RepID=A0A6P5ZDU2_DURZI|nr:ankyrin repeat-containing protein NPR4-like isoform X2 [Durio zibethinus]XP_022750960.1 ankyrin repeat-containing protein NPR4-like isoform X2 [Durio zibethinus]
MRPTEATHGALASPPYKRSASNTNEDKDSKDASIRCLPLYKALDSGDLEATKKFLDQHPDAVSGSLSMEGDTPLHIAVIAGHIDIVEELVGRMSAQEIAVKQKLGSTALNFAAIGGVTEIAELLVKKNRDLLKITNARDQIPVVVAALYGHRDLVHYLYMETPIEELDPTSPSHGALLLTACIIDEFYDIALDIVQRCPLLAIAEDTDKDTAFNILAERPSAFPSGTQLALWQRWIYKCIQLHPQKAFLNASGDIERPHEGTTHQRSLTNRALHQLSEIFWKVLKLSVPGFTSIYELKLTHLQAKELLTCICTEVSNLEDKLKFESLVKRALFEAVKQGIVEFVTEIMKHYPEVVWFWDEKDRNIFFVATAERQEKIFSLIYKMGAKKNSLATYWDKDFNNMLHQAALLAPSSQLDRVSGAVLQMQRELQWFKEVESVVQPKYKEMINIHYKTPRAFFSDHHKKLVEQGEKWTKETAKSCTVVTALIVTIMFSALFTVPGGYDNSGVPLYLNSNSFMIFIISDALSLFTSTTSLLMFLGILTSRYREEDFLQTVPTKLMVGLSMLFFSIASMMTTFGIALFLDLRDRIPWVSFPIILLASLPVTLFALLQFPLLVEIFISKYGPGIFDKPKKPW